MLKRKTYFALASIAVLSGCAGVSLDPRPRVGVYRGVSSELGPSIMSDSQVVAVSSVADLAKADALVVDADSFGLKELGADPVIREAYRTGKTIAILDTSDAEMDENLRQLMPYGVKTKNRAILVHQHTGPRGYISMKLLRHMEPGADQVARDAESKDFVTTFKEHAGGAGRRSKPTGRAVPPTPSNVANLPPLNLMGLTTVTMDTTRYSLMNQTYTGSGVLEMNDWIYVYAEPTGNGAGAAGWISVVSGGGAQAPTAFDSGQYRNDFFIGGDDAGSGSGWHEVTGFGLYNVDKQYTLTPDSGTLVFGQASPQDANNVTSVTSDVSFGINLGTDGAAVDFDFSNTATTNIQDWVVLTEWSPQDGTNSNPAYLDWSYWIDNPPAGNGVNEMDANGSFYWPYFFIFGADDYTYDFTSNELAFAGIEVAPMAWWNFYPGTNLIAVQGLLEGNWMFVDNFSEEGMLFDADNGSSFYLGKGSYHSDNWVAQQVTVDVTMLWSQIPGLNQ